MSFATNGKQQISIRDMMAGDIPLVMQIEREVFPDPWSATAFQEQINSDGWGAIVAESDGRIIGYACYYTVANESHLTNIAVSHKYRRKSVAKQLLDNILQVIKDCNCEYIFLEVRPSNTGAIAFYERFGFEVMYSRPKYYRQPIEDALVMGKYLAAGEKDQQL